MRTKNNLTLDQEKIVREFYDTIVSDDTLWSDTQKTRSQVAQACVNQLGYAYSGSGGIVSVGTTVKWTYGQPPPRDEDLYANDGIEFMKEYDEANKNSGSNKTSTRKSSKSK